MNIGVTMNGKHSFTDYGLFTISADTPVPSPRYRKQFVDVPGRNGSIDISAALNGKVQYERIPISIRLGGRKEREDWPDFISDFLEELHGKVVSIIFDNDQEYCYYGRANVSVEYEPGRTYGYFTINVDADPFKREVSGVTPEWLWDPFSLTDGQVRCYENMVINGTAEVVKVLGDGTGQTPVFYASCPMTMTFGGTTYNIVRGRNYFSGIHLASGYNIFTFNGFGTVTIRYGEAIL